MKRASLQLLVLLGLCAAAAGAASCRRLVKSLGPVAIDAGIGSSVSAAELAESPQDCALRCGAGTSDCALAVFNSRSRLCRTLRLLDSPPLTGRPNSGHVTLGSEDGDEVWLAEDFWQTVERLRPSSTYPPQSTTAEVLPGLSLAAHRFPVVHPGYQQQIDGRTFWVFQQRQTGEVAFNRTWDEYVSGFGNAVEFWAGLEELKIFTRTRVTNLRIEAVTVYDEIYVFEWLNFTVGDSGTNYRMNYDSLDSARSTIRCDSLWINRGQQFSTIDRDNDAEPGSCCATYGGGGFWWGNCMAFNPNGLYSSTLISNSRFSYMATECIGGYRILVAMRMMLQV